MEGGEVSTELVAMLYVAEYSLPLLQHRVPLSPTKPVVYSSSPSSGEAQMGLLANQLNWLQGVILSQKIRWRAIGKDTLAVSLWLPHTCTHMCSHAYKNTYMQS